ncbi:MAG: GIY-YIG nuclease family protein [Cytophagales bacterium]|nr:GIY-YIG nuclease family protein [Cytophagales bacterium]
MGYYVYILQSQINGSLYKGSTNDLVRRLEEHNLGKKMNQRQGNIYTLSEPRASLVGQHSIDSAPIF